MQLSICSNSKYISDGSSSISFFLWTTGNEYRSHFFTEDLSQVLSSFLLPFVRPIIQINLYEENPSHRMSKEAAWVPLRMSYKVIKTVPTMDPFLPPLRFLFTFLYDKSFQQKTRWNDKVPRGRRKKNLSRRDLALPCRRIPKTDGNLLLVCLCTCFAFTYV